MKANLTTRMARLEAKNPDADSPIAAMSDEEVSRGLALIRATISFRESGLEANDDELAKALGWSPEEFQATSAQCLAICVELEKQGRL